MDTNILLAIVVALFVVIVIAAFLSAALVALLPGAWRRDAGRTDEDVPKDEGSPAAWALARRLLLYEAGGRAVPSASSAARGGPTTRRGLPRPVPRRLGTRPRGG